MRYRYHLQQGTHEIGEKYIREHIKQGTNVPGNICTWGQTAQRRIKSGGSHHTVQLSRLWTAP